MQSSFMIYWVLVTGNLQVAGLVTTLLVLSMLGVPTGAAPVLTIHSPDGDVIDCVNKFQQPALKNLLLKTHIIQETPSDMVKSEESIGWQVWHANGARCPDGTVPIRRFEDGVVHQKQRPLVSAGEARATKGHQYAIGFTYGYPIYGARARLNIWEPVVEYGQDFSLAQIWVRSGEYETNDVNTVEAGWEVYPSRYNDNQPRLFTYWTRDSYVGTGCYGAHCDGFVQVSSTISLEAAINTTSTVGGDQFDITVQIWKDRVSGHWWVAMGVNLVPVGYWPAEIFTTLFDHAKMAQWGGEVYRDSTNTSKILQMGSGEYAEKGYRKAAFVCNVEVAQENRTFLPPQIFQGGVSNHSHYTIKRGARNQACGEHFFYGGPGPIRSVSPTNLNLPSNVFIAKVLAVAMSTLFICIPLF